MQSSIFFKADGLCYIIQEIYGIENKKDGNRDKVEVSLFTKRYEYVLLS